MRRTTGLVVFVVLTLACMLVLAGCKEKIGGAPLLPERVEKPGDAASRENKPLLGTPPTKSDRKNAGSK